jgi:hypothetical protein
MRHAKSGNCKFSSGKPPAEILQKSRIGFGLAGHWRPALASQAPTAKDMPNMTTNNVVNLAGEPVREYGEPNESLVKALDDLLADAKAGRLQTFLGTGWSSDGDRVSLFVADYSEYYATVGAIEELKFEYQHRREDE